MTNEQTGQLTEQLGQIQARLEHIEKNLILQQPNVVEFTKQVYPHIEAVVKKCETVEQRQLALGKVVSEHEAHMAENWQATNEIVEKQKTDFAALGQLFQGKATKELQGYHQLIRDDLARLLKAEKSCQESLTECKTLVQQVGQTYETASATVGELAETSRKHLSEVTESSVEAVEQARAKFVKTFRRLDTTLWDHPIIVVVMVILIAAVISGGTSLMMSRFLTEQMVVRAVEASTVTTQEALNPVVEKIERQTRSLDTTFQQSEAFVHYLRTLPANQRDRKRVELLDGAERERAAEDARRRAN